MRRMCVCVCVYDVGLRARTQIGGMIRNWDKKKLAGLDATQVGALSPSQLSLLSPQQLSALSPTALVQVGAWQLKLLEPEQVRRAKRQGLELRETVTSGTTQRILHQCNHEFLNALHKDVRIVPEFDSNLFESVLCLKSQIQACLFHVALFFVRDSSCLHSARAENVQDV